MKMTKKGKAALNELAESLDRKAKQMKIVAFNQDTGALDTMLAKIAEFYEEEVDTAVAGLLTLLEPVMIAFLGIVVGGIVVAMYLPIFGLISQLT